MYMYKYMQEYLFNSTEQNHSNPVYCITPKQVNYPVRGSYDYILHTTGILSSGKLFFSALLSDIPVLYYFFFTGWGTFRSREWNAHM